MRLFVFASIFGLLCGLTNSANGQTRQSIHFSATVSAVPLAITPGVVELDGLQIGQTYTSVPNGSGGLELTPSDGAATVTSATETIISGDINASILVSFVLPKRLYPSTGTGSGYILTRFSETSAAWGPGGGESNYFNPNVPIEVSLDASGTVHLILGGIFEVPPTTGGDTYVGEALLTAQYTGM